MVSGIKKKVGLIDLCGNMGGDSGGGGIKARFEQKYDVSSLSKSEYMDLATGIVNDDTTYDYDFITIRNVEPQYAEKLRASNVWEDGRKTSEKLDGVSTLDTRITYNDSAEEVANKLEKAIERSKKVYGFGERKPFIVIGNSAYGGNDNNELIITDGKLLDISKYIKR